MSEKRDLSPYLLSEQERVAYRIDHGAPSLYASPVYSGDIGTSGLFDLRNYWLVFYKRRVLVLTVAAIVLAITFYRIHTAPTTYVASTQIRIDPMGPQYINL